MASKIEWTGSTWNPVAGCSLASPGCARCYAMRMARRQELMSAAIGRVSPYAGLTKVVNGHAVWTGEVRAIESALTIPLRVRKPTTWFVNSMSDLFHEGIPDEVIDSVFAVMALCPQHTFQVLTKRSARMRAYMASPNHLPRIVDIAVLTKQANVTFPWPLPNVWLGVSAEDQRRADERVPDLLATPAAIRFVSAEPLLEPIDFEAMPFREGDPRHRWSALTGQALLYATGSFGRPDITVRMTAPIKPRLDWIIAGAESGRGARDMDEAWVRSIRDQCASAGVAFFYKQDAKNGRKIPLPALDGVVHTAMPAGASHVP